MNKLPEMRFHFHLTCTTPLTVGSALKQNIRPLSLSLAFATYWFSHFDASNYFGREIWGRIDRLELTFDVVDMCLDDHRGRH
jgi:hypothetical protein